MLKLPTVQRAILSVSDKTDIVEFAKQLHQLGIELIATGGTAALLSTYAIPHQEVSTLTGFPEILNGRVKTLHPHIHAGILARRGTDEAILEKHHIAPIDMVVVNLYPFEKTVAQPKVSLAEAIESIDIGGPTLLRAAAKNFEYVTVITDPLDYKKILEELIQHHNKISRATRLELAHKTFLKTAEYDAKIAEYFTEQTQPSLFPSVWQPTFKKIQDCRYGENPHQAAALYQTADSSPGTLSQATQWQGKELSFNNFMDSDTAIHLIAAFPHPAACVIVKHATPCGAALGNSLLEAYQKAYATDPNSAFGGIIAFNQLLDKKTAQKIIEQQFVEIIVAPAFEKEALTILSTKPNVRVLSISLEAIRNPPSSFTLHSISGGLLVQEQDCAMLDQGNLEIVTEKKPTPQEWKDLLFAWEIAKMTKSNAIVYAKEEATLGIGAGQTSRICSTEIAIKKAQEAQLSLAGAVMASDAFFPFADSIEAAVKAGIKAIIQPGGSLRDNEVIKAANQVQVAMVFTKTRCFRH